MEDLIKNDATYEVYHNTEGGQLLNNRVLTSYPNEKSSFQVFLGFEGEEANVGAGALNKADKTKTTESNPKIDPEKVAGAITSGATAISSVGSTIQAFKGDGTKAPSRRKQLKEVCGAKPVFGKDKKKVYNDCVAKYNADKLGGTSTSTPPPPPPPPPTDENPPANNTKIVIGLVVVGVLVTAFIGYKKGWFGKKAG